MLARASAEGVPDEDPYDKPNALADLLDRMSDEPQPAPQTATSGKPVSIPSDKKDVDFELRLTRGLDALERRSAMLDKRTARLDERTTQLAEGARRLESIVIGELAELRRCVA